MKNKFVLIVVLLLILTVCGNSPLDCQRYDKTIIHMAKEYNVPSVSAVLIQGGKKVWQNEYGEGTQRDSLYCIGSVSKSFVAALALILEQEDILNLDDTIGRYLPDFPYWNKDQITLRELLSMRSGIADYMTDFQRGDYFKEYEPDNLIQMGIDRSALLSQGYFNYSNTNILIACQMIEKATGKSCEELIREKILNPLELNDTFFAEEKQSIRDRLITGYSNTKTEKKADFTNTTSSWADLACGMYSTASDMAKWGYSLICDDLLNETSKQELFGFLSVRDGIEYGLCVVRQMLNKEQVIFLQGNVPGYGAAIIIRNDIVCAVLCNLSDYTGRGISCAEEIASELLYS